MSGRSLVWHRSGDFTMPDCAPHIVLVDTPPPVGRRHIAIIDMLRQRWKLYAVYRDEAAADNQLQIVTSLFLIGVDDFAMHTISVVEKLVGRIKLQARRAGSMLPLTSP